MILVDANLFIYAHDLTSPFHAPARRWIEQAFLGAEPVRLSRTTLLAFWRITTHPRAFASPFSLEILSSLLRETKVTGALIMDAHLAALAIEHGAVLYSTDGDFDLFPDLRRINPLAPKEAPSRSPGGAN